MKPEGFPELIHPEEAEARKLTEHGTFFEKRECLKKAGLLQSQIERVRATHEAEFEAPFLTPEDWEMLTILELYDPFTFAHSVRVEKELKARLDGPGENARLLTQALAASHLTPEDLRRSGFLHDIGKTAIPKEVLHNEVHDDSWKALLRDLIEKREQDGATPESDEELAEYRSMLVCIEKDHALCKDHVPLWLGLLPQEIQNLPKHIDPKRSLGEAIRPHQDETIHVLETYAGETPDQDYAATLRQDALLAGNHHDRPGEMADPFIRDHFVIVSALRAADVLDAVRHPRAYHNGRSQLHSLSILVDEAKRGFLDMPYMRTLISDELDHGQAAAEMEGLSNNKEQEFVKNIQDFLHHTPPSLQAAA